MRKRPTCHFFLESGMLAGIILCAAAGGAQESGRPASAPVDTSLNESVQELRQQVRELREAVSELREESQRYRAETSELRKEMESLRAGAAEERATTSSDRAPEKNADSSTGAQAEAGTGQDRPGQASRLDEEYQLLSGKIDEQYQTKVESASRYRVRLSGLVLLNLFSNIGTVDNIDLPSLSYDNPQGSSGGSFGATLRQSELGLEVFGPQVAGARTRADLQVDLAGGFERAPNGVNAGLLRLRTGTMRLDWAKTSIVAGQDALFFSPTTPTSFASLAVPALSYAGNLWSWTPQVRVEHRFAVGEGSDIVLQGGILDPLSGEPPLYGYYRQPVAGEQSRQPAYATRVGWVYTIFGQPLRIGVAGYYSRQDYGFNRNVDAWAGMSDWDLPITRQISLSGKIYRGRGLGGIGGGIGRSALFSGDPMDPATTVRPLNSVGGWAQLKYKPVSKLEFNGAFGQDNPYAADVAAFFPGGQAYGDPTLTRNQEGFFNVIYRPRSDLLFSAEYRHLKSYKIDNGAYPAHHINLMMGVLF